ncbi:ATP-binding cassette domain-containing protein [Microcoleus sp. herbarium19]|uniref:phosphonate ABC transporter ATP-binding protein n=1 Tax=unclassified Microcoleus TaxID=2642155 RepID=UPI002FD7347F
MTIECSKLETAYSPSLNRPILNGIDCKIKQGEFVALLGLNGAGKSTLLRSFVGLVPVKSGEIRINDIVINTRTIARIRRDIGLIFQGGGLVKQSQAIDNVLCGCLGSLKTWETLWGFPKKKRDRALELLANFGLQDLAYQKTGQLSGGQQQKVAIARALIQSPQILLADEPTTGLDVIAAQQVMEILSLLHKEQGMTVVVVLHDLGMASTYPERAIVLDCGQIVYDGKCHNLSEKFSKSTHPKVEA